jgi:hypothetical protein
MYLNVGFCLLFCSNFKKLFKETNLYSETVETVTVIFSKVIKYNV